MTDATRPRIMPCPFCGAEPCATLDKEGICHDILCTGCGAALPVTSSPESAIEQWNTRPTSPPSTPTMREALTRISAFKYEGRNTVGPGNAWDSWQLLNRKVCEIFDIADAALSRDDRDARTCATCNAILADGPQPAATYAAEPRPPSLTVSEQRDAVLEEAAKAANYVIENCGTLLFVQANGWVGLRERVKQEILRLKSRPAAVTAPGEPNSADRVAQLENSLRGRDEYIVSKGLWLEFIDQLRNMPADERMIASQRRSLLTDSAPAGTAPQDDFLNPKPLLDAHQKHIENWKRAAPKTQDGWKRGDVHDCEPKIERVATADIDVGDWSARIECHGDGIEDAKALREIVMSVAPETKGGE